jgi:hypothetical protein
MRVLSTKGLLNLETIKLGAAARPGSLVALEAALETACRVLKRWAQHKRFLFSVIPGRLEEANPE